VTRPPGGGSTARGFALMSGAFCALAVVMGSEGRHDLAMGLFIAPIAYYWASGRSERSLLLALMSVVSSVVGMGHPFGAVLALLGIAAGVLLGEGFRRRWSFGWCTSALTALLFGVAALNMLLHWEQSREMATLSVSALIVQVEAYAAESGGDVPEAQIESLRQLGEFWPCVGMGIVFGCTLLSVTLLVAVVSALLRKRHPGVVSKQGFARMRPPEWLVWAAIAMALLWFIDHRWPQDVVRVVAWNGAVALFFVYCLNGLSILVHAFRALRALQLNPVLYYGALLLALLQGTYFLGSVGLFDTWWDLRARIERLVEARKAQGPPPLNGA
jgi:uncharacterized protein YybS (DUF2232 family)